tara:strand:- start:451 stop:1527 length:1077 start_codon:yes stop_codon:yes gene_type:complete
MKVVILQDHLRGGGTERQSIALSQSLADTGFETQLIVARSGGALDLIAKESLNESVLFCAENTYLSNLRTWRTLLESANPNTALIPMGRWANSLSALLPERAFGKRFATVRTNRPLPYLYRRAIRTADQMIANSQWALNYALDQSGRSTASPSTIIYNGLSRIDLLKIDPSQKIVAKAALGIARNCSLLIAVARFDKGKGQADLIQMMAQPCPYQRKLFLIGSGNEEAALRQLVNELGLAASIEFTGFKEDLAPYYAAADLALSASRLDSLPNALLEAQAAGLPVIAYPTAGVPEIIQHQTTGFLVETGSIDQLNTHCTQLLSNATMAAKMGAAARAHIKVNFSKEEQLSKYSDLLQP